MRDGEPKSEILNDLYEKLPEDIRHQLQDHVNHLLAFQTASAEGGIDYIRRRKYSVSDGPLKKFEFYGNTEEKYMNNESVKTHIQRLNALIEEGNFALVQEVPPDPERIKKLEKEIMEASYGISGWNQIKQRNEKGR